jgi:uncharacterized protein involved in exopolysaccharide biosynthesis
MNKHEQQDINPVPAPQYYFPPMSYPQEDEINLLDIWRILVKKKLLILSIFLLITLVGSGYALIKAEVYGYSTAIQIGSFFVDGKKQLVDEVNNANTKVKEVLIASALGDFYRDHPEQAKNIKIEVTLPKESELLIISGKCSEQNAAIYQELINKISSTLIASHVEITKARRDGLINQMANLKKRLEIVDDNEKELNKRIEGFDKTMQTAPIDNSGTTTLVLTELSKQKLGINKEKFDLQFLITAKENELSLIQETKAIYPVTKSIEPVGVSKMLLIILSGFIGIILGVFMAMAWDAIEKMKGQSAAAS